MLPLLPILLFLISASCWATSTIHTFTVYAYLPWKQASNSTPLANELLTHGIHPIKVIYEKDYFSQGKIDLQKIKKIAVETRQAPDVPVSFDLEFGNRFAPETVMPKMKAILQAYHHFKPSALVGIYATLPQNTYGWNSAISSYNTLNVKYTSLVEYVNFTSPSLYNYNGHDFQAWEKSARFNLAAAKKYALNKPVIPYISPIYPLGASSLVKNGTVVEELDHDAMAKRLQLLYDLGASGCIIWASSQDRTKDGEFPRFSAYTGWGKAVVEFIKTHPSSASHSL